jgi:DNA-binding MarR family transcriptional regulator
VTDSEETKIFGSYIDRTMKVIRQQYTLAFKEIGADITTEQWVIIDSLFHSDGQSQTEIADGSFKNMATVSRIIDLICEKGYTERFRSESDKRRYKIFLTDKGREIYHKVKPKVDQLRRQGWQGLSNKDYDDFLRIMNRVFDNFQELETD